MRIRSFFYSFPILSFLLGGCVAQEKPVAAPASVPPLVRSLGPGLLLEIDPRLELLAGVQSQTSWSTDPASDGYMGANPKSYVADLRDAFRPFRTDPAVALSESLLKDHGFSYDAPPAFVLAASNGLAFDQPAEGYSTYLKDRAGGNERLLRWAITLRNLAANPSFSKFFEAHRGYYNGLLDQASNGLDAAPLVQWLRNYYGAEGEYVFHFVLAPAMLPGGGYGTTVVRNEGGHLVVHVYQVIRDAETVSGSQLAALTLHEFGHSFVNPAIGDQIPDAAQPALKRLFAPVKAQMEALAYGQLPTNLNELVLRATTIRGLRLLGQVNDAGAKGLAAAEASSGFTAIGAVLTILEDYEAHRDRWPRFQDFGPELLTRLAGQVDTILANTAEPTPVPSLHEGFEGSEAVLGPPWTLSVGASTLGDGRQSEAVFDTRNPAEGTRCLTLRGQAETSTWQLASVALEPRRGTVVARFQVRGRDLRQEAKQFNNAYAGFLLEGKDGKKRFEVRPFAGTFGWRTEEVRLEVNPDQVKSLRFGLFLSISGELSFDDLSVTWN